MTPTSVPIVVHGASGCMGRAILRAVSSSDDLQVVAALVRPGSADAGKPLASMDYANDFGIVCSVALSDDSAARVLIDFSSVNAFDAALEVAVRRGLAFVSGTTGLDERQFAALDRAAASIPVLWSANFSLGVAMLTRLVGEAARSLPDWDCEIAEAHHRRKIDAPSGTALALGDAVAHARGLESATVARLSRVGGDSPRSATEIGFAVTRAGDIVGEHTVMFASAGERIELVHRATDRAIFANGAVAAARWIADRKPDRYRIDNVLCASM